MYFFVVVGLTNTLLGFPLSGAITALSAPAEPPEAESPLDLSGSPKRPFFKSQANGKKSRFLSKKAVAILQHWYQNHRDHPYATDDEVKELAAAGAITPNQVNVKSNV